MVAPRRQGVEYDVEDAGGPAADPAQRRRRENFELATAPLSRPGRLDAADRRTEPHPAARTWTRSPTSPVVYFRRDGLTGLRVLPRRRRRASRDARDRLPRAGLHGRARRATRTPTRDRFRLRLHLAGHPGLGLRLRHGHRRADPAQAAAGAAARRRRPRTAPAGLRAAPGVGHRRRRHPGADLAGLPQGHAAGRQRALPAVRLRQLRDLHGPAASPSPACRCSTAGSCSRSRTSAAAARWAGPGTTDGKLLRKKNTFTDFVACARHLVAAGLDVGRPGWSPAAARRAAC